MPELPEAETMARDLAAKTVGLTISKVLVSYPPIVASDKDAFSSLLTGQTITQVGRVGKWILLDLTQNRNLLIHLKMTGQFEFGSFPKDLGDFPPHCHAAFGLIEPNDSIIKTTLFYKDTRKFGRLRAFGPGELAPFLNNLNLGPDALTASAEEYHVRLTKAARKKLKAALLDQTILAGFGNIYADETLLAARLSPLKAAGDLTLAEATILRTEAIRILNLAITHRGSTVSSYKAPDGAGSYQDQHLAYGKQGQPCPFCGQPLTKTTVGGRTTVHCPSCQK
ncbi:MAG: bifunctional DNA-formamidopyrimidine glycosylase/DNA-(apurinic or apyrimidinic site) lyase [Deltaproteobacteria bacterium]|jgi:formamidopyrimidine-DNA glycosylase|nr:bifunctional DNA-formamidopyrimidine glycosylase/DNA-(apurinic or apyrimidinic site) lyase [Deltaproteobacteria bacterium]